MKKEKDEQECILSSPNILSCNYVTQRRYTTMFYNKGTNPGVFPHRVINKPLGYAWHYACAYWHAVVTSCCAYACACACACTCTGERGVMAQSDGASCRLENNRQNDLCLVHLRGTTRDLGRRVLRLSAPHAFNSLTHVPEAVSRVSRHS